jgi:excinuclease UvrABC nuclease subunit
MSTVTDKSLRWSVTRGLDAAIRNAPKTSGVYAIGIRASLLGLPTDFQWVYIGKSKALPRRLAEHRKEIEENPRLQAWLTENYNRVEIWVARVDNDALAAVETKLIKELQPDANRIRYLN